MGQYGKNWHIPPNISECTEQIFNYIFRLGSHMDGYDLAPKPIF